MNEAFPSPSNQPPTVLWPPHEQQVLDVNGQVIPTTYGQGPLEIPEHPAASYDQSSHSPTEVYPQPDSEQADTVDEPWTHEGNYAHAPGIAHTGPEPGLHNSMAAEHDMGYYLGEYDRHTGFEDQQPAVGYPDSGAPQKHTGGHDPYDFGPNAV